MRCYNAPPAPGQRNTNTLAVSLITPLDYWTGIFTTSTYFIFRLARLIVSSVHLISPIVFTAPDPDLLSVPHLAFLCCHPPRSFRTSAFLTLLSLLHVFCSSAPLLCYLFGLAPFLKASNCNTLQHNILELAQGR